MLYYQAWNWNVYLITLTEHAEWAGLFEHEIKMCI